MEMTTGDNCLETSPGYYIKQTVNVTSYCMVRLAIPNLLTVKTWILLVLSRLIIQTRDMKDAGCLHVVQILQRPTSPSTKRYNQHIKVNASKKYIRPLAAAIYSKLTKQSTWQYHQANAAKSGFKAEMVRALGTLHGLQSQMEVTVERRRKSHFSTIEQKENWIKDHVDSDTAVARQQVADSETVIKQEQEDMRHAEKAGLTTRKPKKTFEEILNAIRDSLTNLASSDDAEDPEDEEDNHTNAALRNLTDDDKPGCVMERITRTVPQCMVNIPQIQMKLIELMQLDWGDAANSFCERDTKYRTAELKVPAAVAHQWNKLQPHQHWQYLGHL